MNLLPYLIPLSWSRTVAQNPLSWCPSVLTLTALALAGAACSSAEPQQLVAIDEIEPGDECAEGGIVVHSGTDLDGDGTLDEDEIEESHVVCHGETPAVVGDALIEVTELERGDESCPHGGLRIDVGSDDGSGGGIAGDGALQPGEIDQTTYLCHSAPMYGIAQLDPPDGPEGTSTIDLSGGGGLRDGGPGGVFIAGSDEGAGLPGGHVKVFRTGEVDASFSVPPVSTWLGDNPAVIQSSQTLAVDPSNLTHGELYLETGAPRDGGSLYIYDEAAGDGVPATGLHVHPGVTLNLPPNYGVNGTSDVRLQFSHDILNEGRIRTTNRQELRLHTRGIYHGPAGSEVDLDGQQPSTRLEISADHLFLNEGALRASGPAPEILLSGMGVWNTGPIVADGPPAEGGEGSGGGGRVGLEAHLGGIHNSGPIDARGIDGAEGGQIHLTSSLGNIRNVGDLDASAADCGDYWCDRPDAQVGSSPALSFMAFGGSIHTSGALTARGGSITFPDDYSVPGGTGGHIRLRTESGPLPAGGIHVSGTIDARGGEGGEGSRGGDGGRVSAQVEQSSTPSPEIVFYGYTDLLLDGGAGEEAGGDGGEAMVANACPTDRHLPTGGVVNLADVSARGGTGEGGEGGQGGSLNLWTCEDPGFLQLGGAVALQRGDVDVSGGASTGADVGGDGGGAMVLGWEWAENTGAMTLRGGEGADGGRGGFAELIGVDHQVTNTGTYDASGGHATSSGGDGGPGGILFLAGRVVDNSGDLLLRGGDGGTEDGRGADGGEGELFSFDGPTVHTGAVDVRGGTGPGGDGQPGGFFLDGQNHTEDGL